RGRVDVRQPPARMVREQMPAALCAPGSFAVVAALETADELRAARDLDVHGLPQREGVDGPGRPRAASAAVTITPRFRRARDFERYRAAEASARVYDSHIRFPRSNGLEQTSADGAKLGLVEPVRRDEHDRPADGQRVAQLRVHLLERR